MFSENLGVKNKQTIVCVSVNDNKLTKFLTVLSYVLYAFCCGKYDDEDEAELHHSQLTWHQLLFMHI